jgi:hypothetical protein
MILKIDYRSGEQGVNYREFHLDAYHIDATPETATVLLAHLADLLTGLHPGDVMDVIPIHIPELEGATVSGTEGSEGR